MMTLEEALAAATWPGPATYDSDLGPCWVDIRYGGKLDGEFTATELRAIANAMDRHDRLEQIEHCIKNHSDPAAAAQQILAEFQK